MKIQFKVQQFQSDAVDAVVDCFAGQPRITAPKYLIDPGLVPKDTAISPSGPKSQVNALDDDQMQGFRNAALELTDNTLLDNVRRIQLGQNIPQSDKLIGSPSCRLNFDVEMETGTGKTYCYIKTMFEMHQRYGWNKFIVVVPSVAIREGVQKSFAITADHFQQQYNRRARAFAYDSKQLHELESFSSDSGVNVMIVNVQAFNAFKEDAKNKAARIMFSQRDDFQSRRPIDVLAANRPIMILDEPQRMGGTQTVKALAQFNPLMMLRYSATHKVEHNKVYRLDALDAYNQKLVKKIAVRGISTKGLKGTDGYLYLEGLRLSKSAPKAVVEFEQKQKSGIRRVRKAIDAGTDLYVASGELDQYKGFVVSDIDARGVEGFGEGYVEFTNGERLTVGATNGDVNEDTLRRLQIRESIKAHMEKEQELHAKGIKVLSLFFIDTVAKYRQYDDDGNQVPGDYARYFEEEYAKLLTEYRTIFAEDAAYVTYLDSIDTALTHAGYFSIDKNNRLTDPKIKKSGETKGETDDVDAYDLILKDKETLLSLPSATDDEPLRRKKNVRFIFSHSALREGWDNPNVFVIGMLKPTDYEGSTATRRQEVGRGLRLCVDANGQRIDDPSIVHDVNVLTVVANESFQEFVTRLQSEMADSLSARPRFATEEYFSGKLLQSETGETIVDKTMASQIYFYLVQNGYCDIEKKITPKYHEAKEAGELAELPTELQQHTEPIINLIDSVFDDSKLPKPGNGRAPKGNPINRKNYERDEFQKLWKKINHKAVYSVDFETDELIANCVGALNQELHVAKLRYEVQRGRQKDGNTPDDLARRTAFELAESQSDTIDSPVSTDIQYDLVGKLSEATQLTRHTIVQILSKITPNTFAQFQINPEDFLTKAARIINEQKATVIIEHLVYNPLDGEHHSDIFTAEQKGDLTGAYNAERHVYDYVITDSKVERKFVETLDKSTEVCVYAKLPRAFAIPTPVGNYNPDWAIAFEQNKVKHVFFIAETKGSMSTLELKKIETAKIDCARKFFAKITDGKVKYDVVDSYDKLMGLVV